MKKYSCKFCDWGGNEPYIDWTKDIYCPVCGDRIYKPNFIISGITYKDAVDFLLPKHYSGRKPQIKWAFGLYMNDILKAVCTFGKPASNTLCDGICGKQYSKSVFELNRLCREDDLDFQLSQFVSACLNILSDNNIIIVSYADTGMNHCGYIYQACNFTYTGCTKKRLEFYVENGHSRHGCKNSGKRKVRTSKHRYVYFAFRNKGEKNLAVKNLKYEVEPYPKTENKRYVLGEYQKPVVVKYPPIK